MGSHQLTYPGALCDTLYTIVVDTLPQPKTTETREVCTGKLTVYRGQQFSVGTYNFSFPGPVCDTLITLKVTNNPGQNINIEATICEGELFNFGNAFYPIGSHTIVHPGIPCDTTLQLKVSASDDITVELKDSICIGSTYYFKGKDYSVGYYNIPVQGSTCDTLFVLTLAEAPCTDDDLILTNTFTPNGDGVNDVLRFNNRQVILDSELTIFNRWGDKIYNKQNYTNDWDSGSYPGGTYFYILRIKDKTYKKALTILK
ncbi:MAG: gliding motility-associated C-terminal domain-containing protein [Saprospiraceae bacterium]|nr:gliding motility-associated C-terminal domain-containing protein [Candidatus Brachybacter algidus]